MDSIVKFKNQDFISLRNDCLRRGQLFEDDMFPANDRAIGQKLLNDKDITSPEWKRPKDIMKYKTPNFILNGMSKFDLQQGSAGDCWFLAALGSLTHKPKLLENIIPTNQSFTQEYAGIFHFKFWQCDQWIDVVVDDRLPVTSNRGGFLFVRPRSGNNEFWPCLLEKAYAKLHGSYSQLHSGYMNDSLVELTGGVAIEITPKEVLFKNLQLAEQYNSLITCGLVDYSNNVERLGLVNKHAYSVTGSAEVSLGTHQEKLIRLWNPWDVFRNMHQYFFNVTESMEGINVVVFINIQSNQNILMPLFEVYQSSIIHMALNPVDFKFTNHIQGRHIMSHWNYTEYFHLDRGTYVVVPINDRGLNFYLRIFLKHQDANRDLHENFNLKIFKENRLQDQNYESIFNRYVQQGTDIDASQLQSLLNKELLESNSSEPLERNFTFDECRSIVALMDVEVNGRLDLEEFEQLWKKLLQYRNIFRKVEKNGSGYLMDSDLVKVIKESGLFIGPAINNELLNLMAIRFGDGAGKIYFPDMICFLIRLQIKSRDFHKLSKDGKGLYLTETEWIKLTMYC
ncbi:calpain-13-like [Sminthopsis crassicaudata]|uniref:calpain-13-like n=1 Tax=Sminthopsis crassicaudata TaxID=9301 RepID=UPI003D686DD1